jgi:hypothetical protein
MRVPGALQVAEAPDDPPNIGLHLTSRDTCTGSQGKLQDSELAPLRQYLSDPALKTLPTICSDHAFVLRGKGLVPMGCWDDTQSAVAPTTTAALSKFLDDRIADLHWDGQVKDCPNQGPPGISDEVGPLPGATPPPPRK